MLCLVVVQGAGMGASLPAGREPSNTRIAYNYSTALRMGPGNRPSTSNGWKISWPWPESGNFSRAAQARSIAQPAFSRHIRSLEEWVGVDLFDRSGTRPRSRRRASAFSPAAGSARGPPGRPHQGPRRARPGRRQPELRRHARAVAHLLPALAGQRGVAPEHGPDPDRFRQLVRLRRPDAAAPRAVRAVPRPRRRAGAARRHRLPRSAIERRRAGARRARPMQTALRCMCWAQASRPPCWPTAMPRTGPDHAGHAGQRVRQGLRRIAVDRLHGPPCRAAAHHGARRPRPVRGCR